MKWVLVNYDTGSEIYIEESDNLSPQITDCIDDARVYDERDNPDTKIKFYNSVTGFNWQAKVISANIPEATKYAKKRTGKDNFKTGMLAVKVKQGKFKVVLCTERKPNKPVDEQELSDWLDLNQTVSFLLDLDSIDSAPESATIH